MYTLDKVQQWQWRRAARVNIICKNFVCFRTVGGWGKPEGRNNDDDVASLVDRFTYKYAHCQQIAEFAQ